MAKDAGFKVVAHMMPDLPNVGWERDVEQFIVSDPVKGDNSTKYMYVNSFSILLMLVLCL